MADTETTLDGMSLDDGVLMELTPNWIKLAVPKTTKPRDRALKLKDAKRGIYEVPKSDLYTRATTKLADGSTLVVMRYKAIPRADREAMHAKAVATGLKVADLEAAREQEGFSRRVSIADLK